MPVASATGRIRYNGWIELVPVDETVAADGRSVTVTFRTVVRRWHPGYWLALLDVLLFGLRRG